MILRKIFISLVGVLVLFALLSPVADAGRGGEADLAVAQDRTRSVEDRSRSVMAVGRAGDQNASGPLLQILQNPVEQRRVRVSAVMALARIGEPRAEILSAYETTYKSPKSGQNLRYATLLAFGTMKAVESLPLLTEALSGGDDRIRFKAAQALGMIGGAEAVNFLLSRLEAERDRMVRAEIVRALGRNESSSVEGALVRVLRSDTEPLVRYNAALCLTKFTSVSPEGQQALRAAAGDSSPMVRKAAGEVGR